MSTHVSGSSTPSEEAAALAAPDAPPPPPTLAELRQSMFAAWNQYHKTNGPGDEEAYFEALEVFLNAKIASPGTTLASEQAEAKAKLDAEVAAQQAKLAALEPPVTDPPVA
jgi:hypothetical protein